MELSELQLPSREASDVRRELLESLGTRTWSRTATLGVARRRHPPSLPGPHLPEQLYSGVLPEVDERASWKLELPLVSLHDLRRREAMAVFVVGEVAVRHVQPAGELSP
jgi:hypothetical protein